MRHLFSFSAAATAFVLTACAGDPSTLVEPLSDLTPSFAVSSECGGQTELTDSRAIVDFGTDARQGVSNVGGAYQGGVGGVRAKLFYHDVKCSQSGDLIFDPDALGGKSATRRISISVKGQNYSVAPAVNFGALMQVGSAVAGSSTATRDRTLFARVGDVPRTQLWPASVSVPGYGALIGTVAWPTVRFVGTGIARCETIEVASVTMTRNAGTFQLETDGLFGAWGLGGGSWTITSNGNATCLTSSRKGPLAVGFAFPFTVTVTEVR